MWAGSLSGSIELGYQKSKTKSDNQPDIKTRSFTQRYILDYEGILHREWVGDYRIGITLGKTAMERDNQDTDTTLTGYRLQSKLFPRSPFPLSMYLIKNDTKVNTEVGDDSQITTRMFGADLKLDFRTLPTTNIFYYGQETESTLSANRSDQRSTTAGFNMKKRWKDLIGTLRFEHSNYEERLSNADADANRISTSWTYRPSTRFQASLVISDYEREGNNPAVPGVDSLYSDRSTNSSNLSILWNPTAKLNFSINGNYFLEDYEGNNREAVDGRAVLNYRFHKHLTGFLSSYTIRTTLNQETFKSRDHRAGITYARSGKWGGWEWRGNVSAGFFNRDTEPADSTTSMDGEFYQVGGGVNRPWTKGKFTWTPYYDFSVGRNRQSVLAETVSSSQELGARMDGRLSRGQLSGNISYRITRQKDGLEVTSEQLRSHLDYNRQLKRRARLRLQGGYSVNRGKVVDNIFTSFTEEQDTDIRTTYTRVDFSKPISSSGMMWQSSLRLDQKKDQKGQKETGWSLDIRFSHRYGKLFYEFGYNYRVNDLGGIGASESLIFFQTRRVILARK